MTLVKSVLLQLKIAQLALDQEHCDFMNKTSQLLYSESKVIPIYYTKNNKEKLYFLYEMFDNASYEIESIVLIDSEAIWEYSFDCDGIVPKSYYNSSDFVELKDVTPTLIAAIAYWFDNPDHQIDFIFKPQETKNEYKIELQNVTYTKTEDDKNSSDKIEVIDAELLDQDLADLETFAEI